MNKRASFVGFVLSPMFATIIALAVVLTQCAPDRSPYWDKEAS